MRCTLVAAVALLAGLCGARMHASTGPIPLTASAPAWSV
jgi:hypothetical protein